MKIRKEIMPFVIASLLVGAILAGSLLLADIESREAFGWGAILAIVLICYLGCFFRDPERTAPTNPDVVVAGADGVIAKICDIREDKFLKTDTVRVSIFLSLVNVHVNRAPISGTVKFLDYFRGRRLFTFQAESSDVNQRSSILIEGNNISCLVNQICGPVCRRVVYWLNLEQVLNKGDRIGMMKFGSRLDMYFPKGTVEITAKVGDKVRAGETIIATVTGNAEK